jgi:hypothetical protein
MRDPYGFGHGGHPHHALPLVAPSTDRGANHALHTITFCRLRYDLRTRAYAARQLCQPLRGPLEIGQSSAAANA